MTANKSEPGATAGKWKTALAAGGIVAAAVVKAWAENRRSDDAPTMSAGGDQATMAWPPAPPSQRPASEPASIIKAVDQWLSEPRPEPETPEEEEKRRRSDEAKWQAAQMMHQDMMNQLKGRWS